MLQLKAAFIPPQTDADPEVCKRMCKANHCESVLSLVSYYQMVRQFFTHFELKTNLYAEYATVKPLKELSFYFPYNLFLYIFVAECTRVHPLFTQYGLSGS